MKPSHAFTGFLVAHPALAASIATTYAHLPPELRAALGSAVAFALAKIVKTIGDVISAKIRSRAGLQPEKDIVNE